MRAVSCRRPINIPPISAATRSNESVFWGACEHRHLGRAGPRDVRASRRRTVERLAADTSANDLRHCWPKVLATLNEIMKTIVVAMDGSPLAERALDWGVVFAQRSGASVRLITTLEPWGVVPSSAGEYLADQARRVQGVAVETEVIDVAPPAQAIAQAVADAVDPMVVMGAHGRTGIGKAVLGSTAEAVLTRVDCPLVLVGPHVEAPRQGAAAGPVVVCTDGSALADSVAAAVTHVAGAIELPIFVVEVMDVKGARGGPNDVVESAAAERLARRLGRAGLTAQWETLHSHDPAHAIADWCDSQGASLIAMASHGRTGAKRVIIGSVAISVVRHARSPVLMVRAHPE